MKTAIFFIAVFFSAFTGMAQSFSNMSLVHSNNRDIITFTLVREANVRHYRIEGSTDNTRFQVVATIKSRGNSVQASCYSYDVTSQPYIYYRVAMVQMGGQMPYSAAVRRAAVKNEINAPQEHSATQSPVLVTNN